MDANRSWRRRLLVGLSSDGNGLAPPRRHEEGDPSIEKNFLSIIVRFFLRRCKVRSDNFLRAAHQPEVSHLPERNEPKAEATECPLFLLPAHVLSAEQRGHALRASLALTGMVRLV